MTEVEWEVAGLVAEETEAELVVEKAEERVEEREEGWEEKEGQFHTGRCGPRRPNRTPQGKRDWC